MTNSGRKFLYPEEIDRLFAAAEASKDRHKIRNTAMLRLAYHRGLRASELGILQLADYDRPARRLFVHRLKGSRSAQYLLTDREARALNAWLKLRGKAPGALFPSNRGTAIDRRMLGVLMHRYGALASLPPDLCHMHVLKHSCATTLLSTMGLGVEVVQDHMGHANIRNTMIYARITNRRRDEVGESLRNW